MNRLLDHRLVRQCAPTLAGLKVGSLFCLESSPSETLCKQLAHWNKELNPCGVCVRVIAERCGRSFIYVYRDDALQKLIAEPEIRHFLAAYGYTDFSTDSALAYMTARIRKCHCFPHEVGLFLGYPLEDVKGFIINGGRNSKFTGYWKVYGDVTECEKRFACFRKCFDVFNKLFEKGYSLPMLTVRNAA